MGSIGGRAHALAEISVQTAKILTSQSGKISYKRASPLTGLLTDKGEWGLR